jgi:hypothetical protein
VLNDAVTTLITSYQAWHGEHIQVRTGVNLAAQLGLAYLLASRGAA